MSKSSSREGGAPIWIILALVFPAMIAAAAGLAYYGYQYAEDVSRRMEAGFRETARGEAGHLIEAVESELDPGVRTVLERIELGDDTPETDACISDPLPVVDSYAVVRFTSEGILRVVCVGGLGLPAWRAARTGPAAGPYLKSLDFSSVEAGKFRYLHQRFERQDVLLAYMRKQTPGGMSYFLAARVRPTAVMEIVTNAIATLDTPRRIAIIDQDRRGLAGEPPALPGAHIGEQFLFSLSFGKALYAWDIQIVPRDIEALHAQEKRQRALGPALVLLSTVIIVVGLVIVWLGVLSERRTSRLKGDFIANVSHELKTPLSLIRMFGEMIATGRYKGESAAREYGEIITRESDRLAHLIDNVLDFSRLERGKASYQFSESNLGEVVERALDLSRYRSEKERVKLTARIEPDLPRVRMDEDAITLALLNLIDNAIKYGGQGGLVDVDLRRVPGQVCLRVRDFGPGVPPGERVRIFERFYRAQNARDRNVRGSGIGLSLVKHIAAAHGGRVTVEAPEQDGGSEQPPRGIAFCIYLPAPISEKTRDTPAAAERQVS